MKTNNKKYLTPRLRFPEFEKDGNFQEKPLGYFCNYWNGSGNESEVTEDGQYYLISLNSIDIEGNLKNDMKRVAITDNSLKKGDLVMVLSDVAHGNFLGLTAIIPDNNYVLNQRMAGLRIKDFKKIDPRYLRLFINFHQKYFKRQGQGSSQQNLSKASVINFPVLVPSIQEQQKIADFLSNLDEWLATEEEKLTLLQQHKKGLLQNLFPAQGETVPKLRFPEFKNSGEWEVKRLGEVGEFFGGGTPSTNKVEYWEGDINWFTPTEIKNRYVTESIRKITKLGLDNSSAKLLPVGSILITSRATIGDCAIALAECSTNQGIQSLVVNKNYNNIFIYYWIYSNKNLFIKKSSGSTFSEINKSAIKSIKITIPTLPEQHNRQQ